MSAPRSRRLQRKACVSHFFFFFLWPPSAWILAHSTFNIQLLTHSLHPSLSVLCSVSLSSTHWDFVATYTWRCIILIQRSTVCSHVATGRAALVFLQSPCWTVWEMLVCATGCELRSILACGSCCCLQQENRYEVFPGQAESRIMKSWRLLWLHGHVWSKADELCRLFL